MIFFARMLRWTLMLVRDKFPCRRIVAVQFSALVFLKFLTSVYSAAEREADTTLLLLQRASL